MAEGRGAEGKKIIEVRAFLAEASEEVEADFRVHYRGLDLRDLYRTRGGASRLTFRLVALLIDKLPPESLTKTRERNKYSAEQLKQISKGHRDHGPWSHLELLVAQVVDEVAALTHVTAGGKGPKPKPYPRPGIAGTGAARRGRLTPAQMRTLAAVRAYDPPKPNPTPLKRATP